jgi:hypothetical protein
MVYWHSKSLRIGKLMSEIKEYDAITGTEIVRDMTEAELAQKAKDEKATQEQQKANDARAKLKADTLAKLGLTADEVAALLS